ncbi:tRNA synthetase subunit beta [Streptomyces sp. CB03234]|uniref:B3/B4 domain-containing protein n=1 Tax=Streptomyces sp. (strain CB03234) TaxID=1703937 RepID=UPI00093FC5D1|nr:phenylalanine--tRNA ligase beta subunit-related protein [Streptomyces sp. CB03234]OKK04493.1 tRNA synthetase subunit beta [Streptomyces sp. CB03234]
MYFQHSDDIWRDFPELAATVIEADGITADIAVDRQVAAYLEVAAGRLATAGSEGQLAEIRAWRSAFSRMGLKPTRYRCASESLLRRLRKEGSLPSIHPLIDLCNAVSAAYAIPVGVFHLAAITPPLQVRYADGHETYVTFAGEEENPAPGEVVFADGAGQAHSRRWTNRQSGASTVRPETAGVLIVAEAMHGSAATDVERLAATLATELTALWSVSPRTALLTAGSPRFAFRGAGALNP